MQETDTYKTIEKPSEEALLKEKSSKFFSYAFPVLDEDSINSCLESLKKKHHTARHFCYAWQLGIENQQYRVNDDGEPNNSAGMPIYGQIQAFDLTNVLVVVVRYFGGTKLGVGGLIQAYKTAAQMALESSKIIEKTIDVQYQITAEYDLMNKVLRIVKEKQLSIVKQDLGLNCKYVISVRKSEAKNVYKLFKSVYQLKIIPLQE